MFINAACLLVSASTLFAQVPLTPDKIDNARKKIQAQKIDSVVNNGSGNKPEKKGRMDMLIRYDKTVIKRWKALQQRHH